jgi:hypothetical protein
LNQFKNKILLTLILFVFAVIVIKAQNNNSIKAQTGISDSTNLTNIIVDSLPDLISKTNLIKNIKYDSSDINIRSVDSSKIKSYLREKDFSYFEDPEFTMTLWEGLKDWISKQFAKLLDLDSEGTAWEIFQYILIAFAVIAIIFGLYKSELKGLFFSNPKNRVKSSEVIEDIHSINFEELIEAAIKNKNYRYAIRLNYLRTLKILSDKEIINWKIDKTNRDYFSEIKQSTLKIKFENITLDFESIWYGGIEVNQNDYNELLVNYSDVSSLLEKNQ